jgi:hypothetical protein
LTAEQRLELGRAVTAAERSTGLRFVVRIGELDGRSTAEDALAASTEPHLTVLVAIDPGSRALEIVTGSSAAHVLDDRTCALAALAMTSSFSSGDLVGGARNGLQLLADHARHPGRRHLTTL